MSTQDFLGPVRGALEADLSLWGAPSGVLPQMAREIASAVDTGALQLVDAARELRQLVKAIREQVGASTEETEVDRFLKSIQADG